jgi:hypothetical protein
VGTSRSIAELNAKLAKAAKGLEESTPRTVLEAATSAQVRIDIEIRKVVPDLDMSGLSSSKTRGGKSKSGKVGTRIARSKGNKLQVAVRAVGPVHWLEAGTRAHAVGVGRLKNGQVRLTKKGQYRKGQQKRMNVPGVGWRVGPFQHPGTRAQHTWSKGVRAAVPVAAATFKRRAVADVAAPFL